jgi:hypothetical protein
MQTRQGPKVHRLHNRFIRPGVIGATHFLKGLRFAPVYRNVRKESPLKCLGEERFDVLLLDLSLPDSQEFETLQAVLPLWQSIRWLY